MFEYKIGGFLKKKDNLMKKTRVLQMTVWFLFFSHTNLSQAVSNVSRKLEKKTSSSQTKKGSAEKNVQTKREVKTSSKGEISPKGKASSEKKLSAKNQKPIKEKSQIKKTAEPAKDTVLEDLKFFTQGVDTLSEDDSEDKSSSEKKTSSMEKEAQDLAEKYQKEKNYKAQIAVLDVLLSKKSSKVLERERIIARRKIEYDPHPSRVKKNELAAEFQKIIDKYPNYQEAYWGLFEIQHHYIKWIRNTPLYKEEEVMAALDLLKDIRKKFGKGPKISRYLCQYLTHNRFYGEARSQCQEAKNLNPKDSEVYVFLDYILSGKKSKALLKILKKFPGSQKIHRVAGEMFLEKKEYDLSMKFFKKAVQKDRSDISSLLGLAESLFFQNKTEEALELYFESCQKHILRSRDLFQKAKARLSQKSQFNMASRYQNKINICVNSSQLSDAV